MNFQLFKSRDFSTSISDTILFFKQFGKNYFKNYFLVNGIFLIIVSIFLYFITKFYTQTAFNFGQNQNLKPTAIDNYFQNNGILFVSIIIVAIVLVIIFSLINLCFPAIYLENVEQHNTNQIGVNQIVESLKKNALKLFKFFTGSIFVILPIIIIAFVINILLCFVLIGFPLFIITIPAAAAFYYLVFCEYIIGKAGFFESVKTGFILLKENFWAHTFSTLVIVIIIQIVQGIFTLIPYVSAMVSLYATAIPLENNTENEGSLVGVLMGILTVVSILCGFILNNILYINQGLLYYSHLEENFENTQNNEIELIGSEIE